MSRTPFRKPIRAAFGIAIRTAAFPATLLAAFLFSGCVYFNTFYNAQKAYDQAGRMHSKRMEKNPEDSVKVSPEEKLKLERAIAKSSKVLELYPTKKKYQPKALFLIGESYLALGEYSKAIQKYEELARFFPQSKHIPAAEFHRAECLFRNGQYLAARPALEKVMNGSPVPEYRHGAMALLAKLELENNSPEAALALYEKLLKEQARTPESRANAHFEAAKLAFGLKQWQRARGHAKAGEIEALPTNLRFRCEMLAAECLFRLGKAQEGIGELEAMRRNRRYAASIPEIDLLSAQGYFMVRNEKKAVELLTGVPKLAPKTAFSAEAFYRLGDYELIERKDEARAKAFFDSAAVAGTQFEYGALAAEKSAALSRLADLRKPTSDTTARESHYRDFMIAELFLFRLESVDSALGHLDRIVQDPRQDSSHSMRAAYARAFIQEEFKGSKPTGDSLYRYVLEKYPNTEYAKQAERNLGLKPTVQTDEDKAHGLFLEAEAARFGGGDIQAAVIPAYAKVVADFGGTREAAKAQFVIAMLYEGMNSGEEKVVGSLDSAIAAYSEVRERFPNTPYHAVADAKLAAAGIKPRSRQTPAAPSPAPSAAPAAVPAAGAPGAAPGTPVPAAAPGTPVPTAPAAGEPARPPAHDAYQGRGRPPQSGDSTPAASPAAPDSAAYQPEGKHKEELDTDYENVEQY